MRRTWRSAAPATCSATSRAGTIAAVGFEMYAQMLEEAVQRAGRRAGGAAAPVTRRPAGTAYVPPEYIAYEATKIDAHRRIARARTIGELGDVRAELADRFGAPPEPVENLITLQAIRTKAAELGATAVAYRGSRLQIDGLDLDDEWAARVTNLARSVPRTSRRTTCWRCIERARSPHSSGGSRLRSML